jgi:hypothetical protein
VHGKFLLEHQTDRMIAGSTAELEAMAEQTVGMLK